MIGLVFPGLSDELLTAFETIVREGNEDDLKFVIASLHAYEGSERMYSLCMNIVAKLDEGNDLLKSIALVLQVTGVLRGEFGYVEAHATQKAKLEPWLNDPRERVKAFAQHQIGELEKSMAWEQRRAERDHEARRREWDII